MNVVRSHFTPDIVNAKVGDKVIVHLTNVEQTPDATHGFAVPMKNVMVSLDPGETTTVEFTVDKPGSFSFYCTEFCSALHLEMQGWLIVEPKLPNGCQYWWPRRSQSRKRIASLYVACV